MKKHEPKCRCMICEGRLQELEAMKRKSMETQGWYAHMVPGNYHTHGLQQTFGHPDLQMVLSINPQTLHSVAHNIVDLIREGWRFSHGDIVSGILRGYNVRFVEARECDRTVLRVILPDAEGHLLPDELKEMYAEQYNFQNSN